MKTTVLCALTALLTGATIQVSAKSYAVFHTQKGDIVAELYPEKSPKTVENFIGLATGKKEWTHPGSGQKMAGTPLYNGTKFHRTMPGFMIQGGDPLGKGTGNPGYKIPDEFPDVKFDREGRLAMANAGPNTAGSQFFITVAPTPFLDQPNHYTIFGQVLSGMDVAIAISKLPSEPGSGTALQPVTITSIEIVDQLPGAKSDSSTTATATPDNKTSGSK